MDCYWPMMSSAALITAGELGVFAALGQGPLAVEDLARHIGASVPGTDRLCDVLVQTGYLERTPDDQLRNSPFAQERLSQTGEHDLTSMLRWLAYAWQIMSGLTEAVVNGRPDTGLWDLMQTNPDMGPAFATFMHDYAATVADDVQRAIDLPDGARSLLDVGGSHGLHAAAACRRSPELQAVIYDLPVSLTNTPDLIAGWGLAGRIRCEEGDIAKDSITGTFDVITYFLVAHNHTDATNARIIQKMAAALNPGGVLFVYEFPRDPAARFTKSASEAWASAFDLTLLVETGTHTFTAEQITSWLSDAGLVDIRRTDLETVDNGSVFSARRLA
jgi:SAM-dependent methyltransferase